MNDTINGMRKNLNDALLKRDNDVLLDRMEQRRDEAVGLTKLGPRRAPQQRMEERHFVLPKLSFVNDKGETIEYTDWLGNTDCGREGFQLFVDDVLVPKTDYVRECVTCGAGFHLKTYPAFAEVDGDGMCLPEAIIAEGYAYMRRIDRCEIHRPFSKVPAVHTRRGDKAVWALAQWFRDHNVPVVKGEAGPGEISWSTLFNKPLSLRFRPGEKDVRNLRATVGYTIDADVIGSEMRRHGDGYTVQAVSLQVMEHLNVEDTDVGAMLAAEFECRDDLARQECEGEIPAMGRKRIDDPVGLAYQVIFKARELDRATREELARPIGE